MYKLRYFYYRTQYDVECETIDEAISTARAMLDTDTGYPVSVTDESGRVVLDEKALTKVEDSAGTVACDLEEA